MICEIGREYDKLHPSCMSCEQQGVRNCNAKTRTPRTVHTIAALIKDGIRVLVSSYDLQSPNKYTNKDKGKRIYKRICREWAKLLCPKKSYPIALVHFGKHKHQKRNVVIVRYVTSNRHFMDKDNLYSSCKPVLDHLTGSGVIVDDSPQWIDFDVNQFKDTTARVEISVANFP